ncbi:MAG: methylated-DNA--[protein]-cysteine S-methyltransferase [Bacteroidota bacterium]
MMVKTYCSSPFGSLEIIGSELGIRSIRLVEETDVQLESTVPALLEDGVRQLQEYFDKKRQQFSLQLDWSGAPAFYQAVWKELLDIPYGHTTYYSAIAEKLGAANKMRAVGQANGRNPIPIVVPCHRVIAKNGDLHGYYYGLDMKRKLLELENPMSFATQGRLF